MAFRIIITEDDQVTALFLKRITEQIGHTVLGMASNGEEAIELVKENRVDVVLMDISLQGDQDGISTTQEIIQRYHVPVIYITGTSDRKVMDRALASHPYGYIPKPINQDILQTVIALAVQRFTLEENLLHSQNQLQLLNNQLEQKVVERTKDLINTNRNLEKEVTRRKKSEDKLKDSLAKERELNEMKSRIVNIISHEIKTPLTGVKSSADLIQMHAENNSPIQKILKHTLSIHKSVDSLTHIVNETLQVGKLEAGALTAQIQEENFIGLFTDISQQVKVGIGKNHTVKWDIGTDVPQHLPTDKRLFTHIYTNLLSNAVKYSPKGTTVTATIKKHTNHLEINVIDEGIGIPEEDQKTLFEMFHRAGNVTNIEGVGIGLAIVQKSVEQLQGKLSFTSALDEGTTFTFTHPLPA
jgi:signal transduction histidine kinase